MIAGTTSRERGAPVPGVTHQRDASLVRHWVARLTQSDSPDVWGPGLSEGLSRSFAPLRPSCPPSPWVYLQRVLRLLGSARSRLVDSPGSRERIR
jgi:hypothetical protein